MNRRRRHRLVRWRRHRPPDVYLHPVKGPSPNYCRLRHHRRSPLLPATAPSTLAPSACAVPRTPRRPRPRGCTAEGKPRPLRFLSIPGSAASFLLLLMWHIGSSRCCISEGIEEQQSMDARPCSPWPPSPPASPPPLLDCRINAALPLLQDSVRGIASQSTLYLAILPYHEFHHLFSH
ncbi:hypothetical protein ACP70R_032361 [Stipagrostis hirtigluma subsp. patula]